ncbi:MAG TPA: hypothetical protein VNO30_35705 [Kofleriaceae bacterium]|nr:hypothetical protein [Kofleriaceae bacterium]
MSYGRDKRGSGGGAGSDRTGEPAQHTGLVPGKRTLVEMASPPASPNVGRRADGVRTDGEELRAAIVTRNAKWIMVILARNANPESMAALCQTAGPGIVHRLEPILDASEWARARAYLGEQVALDRQLATHDKDAIFGDLHQLSDRRALDLLSGAAETVFQPPALDAAQGAAGAAASPVPAATTLAAVQAVLRSKLAPDDYARAMRLLLDKAERAQEASHAGQVPPPGTQLGDFTVRLDDLRASSADPTGGVIALIGGGKLDPVSAARVDLAEERIRAADARSGSAEAYLGLADLEADERKALALRLTDRPLGKTTDLAALASETDDATAIHAAILRAQYAASITQQAVAGADLEAAVARIGELVRAARMKLQLLPPSAPAAERERAQAELVRLEQMFFGDRAESLPIREALETAARGDPRAYAAQLRTLGADPVTVGRELLGMVRATDVDGLLDVLALIPAPHRIAALEAADRLADISAPWWPQDKRELLAAYFEQGMRHAPIDPPPPMLHVPLALVGPSPEATLALFEVLAGMDRGPAAAHAVLARLERLSEADHTAVVRDPRFDAKLRRLPAGDIDEVDFKRALTDAKGGVRATQIAILRYPTGPEAPGQRVWLEAIRLKTEEAGGQAAMRRAYVLTEQLKADPQRAARLSPQDQLLLERFRALEEHKPVLDTDAQRATADDIMLGQPQLTDTPDAPLDPNAEAEYMRLRLRKAAQIPDGKPLAEWPHPRPAVTEALTTFEALYTEARPAGVSCGHLAQLAERYYRATDALEMWRSARDENEGLAQLASMVAAVAVAVAVTAATGGALGPVALAALAGISAGTASVISGAAVRWEDSAGSVLKDFGAGAVEGVASVAGAGLASKIVRRASAGLSAGQAAAQAGGHAAQAGGRVAVQVAESAIDGAVGGAAGELFQTAVDEATWDRGIARALASMLAALARGGAIGGAAGGAVGGLIGGLGRLAARAGDEVAHGVGHLLDSSGVGRQLADDLADPAQDALAHAFQLIEAGKLEEAERVLHGIDGMPAKARVMLIEAARGRAAVRSSGGAEAIDLDGESFWPRIVSDKEFRSLVGGKRADAVFLIEGGKPQIIARRGAAPSAIREEVVHLHQWHGDLAMRQKMERLGEDQLGSWATLDPKQKLQLHIDKLQVEADAQRRLIAQLEHAAGGDPETAMRFMDAEETLLLLEQRLETLQGAGRAGAAADLAQLGIEDVPRLYARGAQSPTKITGWHASRARRKFVGRSIDDPGIEEQLTRQGYSVHRDSTTGEIRRIARQSEHSAKLPHLQIKSDRTIAEGGGVPTFAERKARAAGEWTATGDNLKSLEKQLADGQLDAKTAQEARVYIQSKGPRVRAELERRVVRGDIDEGTAGLVAKWGAALERLESDAAAGAGKQLTPFTIGEFLDQVPKGPLSEAQNDKLRRYLRERTLQYIESLERPKDRIDALHAMLDIQPDPGSKGELFHAYRERFMGADPEAREIYDVAADAPGKFRGAGLDRPRTPDGVVNVKLQPDVETHLPPGKYAIEDKAGLGAFKLDQARDYARRAYEKAGGFKLTPHAKEAEYVGLVYVFSRESEARAALKRMGEAPEIKQLLGRHPAGIHVMFFAADTGDLELATSIVYVKKGTS